MDFGVSALYNSRCALIPHGFYKPPCLVRSLFDWLGLVNVACWLGISSAWPMINVDRYFTTGSIPV